MKDGEPDRAVGTVAVFAVTLLLIFAGFSVLWHWKWMIDCLVSAVFAAIFWRYHKALKISVFPFTLIMVFLLLHCAGSFGLYAMFPLGIEYDVYVHLFFGFAFGIAAAQFLKGYYDENTSSFRQGVSWVFVIIIAVLFTMGVSAVHEILEFAGSQVLGPGEGVLFFGAGDTGSSDTEWDMINNLAGAAVGTLLFLVCSRWRRG